MKREKHGRLELARPRWLLALPLTALALLAFGASAHAATPLTQDAYVTNFSDDNVTPVNTATNTAGTPIPVGDGPVGVAVTPDGKTAYVVNQTSNNVTPIDTASNTSGSAIPVGSFPRGIAITPDGKTAYVVNALGSVTPIDTATNTAGSPITLGGVLGGIAITPDGKTAYVAIRNSQQVARINLATNTPAGTTFVGDTPTAIAITPDGKTAYVTIRNDNDVTPIDTTTNAAGTPIAVGTSPDAIAITPDGKTAYVANSDDDNVTPIDTATNTAGATIGVGDDPDAIAITPDGKTAYVSNVSSNNVTPIRTAANRAGAALDVGSFPIGVAITPNQGPTAGFTFTPGASGSPTSFDGSDSSDLDGTVVRYHWNFGDGNAGTTATPSVDHTYAHGGYFRASLTVTDNENCVATFVFTGQTASCNGTEAATVSQRVAIAPTMTIDSGPPPTTTDPTATFDFHSDDPDAGYRCRISTDPPGFTPCTSPQTYNGLTPGRYNFKVKASDGPGNVSNVARWDWRVTG